MIGWRVIQEVVYYTTLLVVHDVQCTICIFWEESRYGKKEGAEEPIILYQYASLPFI